MQLLLPSAHSAVLVIDEKPLWQERAAKALSVFGVLVVLLGGLDLMSRVPEPALGEAMLQTAFSPAVLLAR